METKAPMENKVPIGTIKDQKEKEKPYASSNRPVLEAVIAELFRFGDEKQAIEKVQNIAENFIVAKNQSDVGNDNYIKLWIKGYAITPDEKTKGYLGNYAIIKYKKNDKGKYVLYAEKLDKELKNHPQKKRPKQKHPDWGHPILRNIQKKIVYPDLEQATKQLEKLHEEYPEVSIPSRNKLYIMIYSKAAHDRKEKPVQKMILLIRAAKEGGFFIDHQVNTAKKKAKVPMPGDAANSGVSAEEKQKAVDAVTGNAAPPTPSGYFTSMVQLKKKKPKKPTA